ncbi:MAG: flavin-containing amine oxidase [Verrucomicrobiaceae bacterium]|nr:flavin-containing amine oxidase [Verrucomicrobiaceae bacterium]MDB6117958.1 flavin-containing amine oxidase [Verrucomicrobiaceae bacterium]
MGVHCSTLMKSSLTRRKALQTAGTLLLGSALGAEPPKAKRIVVVGGGIGGLSCAFELMERGHDVTLLEGSRRTGGHVKTIRDPLPDGLYADVGAEHFTNPGYVEYRRYVEKFDLPVLPWARRQNMYRKIDGKWYTEEQLADKAVLSAFGFNAREVDYIREHGWRELPMMYLAPYVAKFKDEYQPFGVGMDDYDHMTLGDVLADVEISTAAKRSMGLQLSKPGDKPHGGSSALYEIWQTAVPKMRGLPMFKREVFHLKGGNQLLPDTFAEKLGDRVHRNTEATAIEHDAHSVTVHYKHEDKEHTLTADHLVLCVSPMVLPRIKISPAWPEDKAFALQNTPMGMQSRVLLVTKDAFWKGDVPSINLETGDSKMSLVYETASDVPGQRRVLMGSGLPVQTPEDTIAAFRKFYPGRNEPTIEQCVVHEWWKEEPLALGCERHPFPFGQLAKIWPRLIEPVGRIHFAGAAFDNLPWGQDAATRSANRVAKQIHAA